MEQRIDDLLLKNAQVHGITDMAEWDKATDALNQEMEELIDNPEFGNMDQDTMIKFLKLAQESAWDIPSALMALCGHLDEDTHYYMHRPPMFEGNWEPADKHFEEEHGWNLKDERIDWSFDT